MPHSWQWWSPSELKIFIHRDKSGLILLKSWGLISKYKATECSQGSFHVSSKPPQPPAKGLCRGNGSAAGGVLMLARLQGQDRWLQARMGQRPEHFSSHHASCLHFTCSLFTANAKHPGASTLAPRAQEEEPGWSHQEGSVPPRQAGPIKLVPPGQTGPTQTHCHLCSLEKASLGARWEIRGQSHCGVWGCFCLSVLTSSYSLYILTM